MSRTGCGSISEGIACTFAAPQSGSLGIALADDEADAKSIRIEAGLRAGEFRVDIAS